MAKNQDRPVLVVFANPRGASSLRLSEEDRAITESIRRAKQRDRMPLTKCHAATVHDLSRAMLDDEFSIVQISGHGTQSGLVLEEDDGSRFVVGQHAIAKTFAAYASPKGSVQCVILNACYSVTTGTLASLGVPYTIAMEGAISDKAAIEFSRGFYDAIGAGKDIEFAYDEGCRRVELAAPGARFVSKLLRAGETYTTEFVEDTTSDNSRGGSGVTASPMILGLGVDLSGSMQGSMRNDKGGAVTRLEGFRRALQRSVQNAHEIARKRSSADVPRFDIFAYGFGLRHRSFEYADLFSLLKVSKDLITTEEIERLKEKHTATVRRKYESKASQYSGFASLANRYVPGIVAGVEGSMRSQAESEVRKLVLADIADRVANRLNDLGNTTLTIQQVAELWEDSENTFDNASELLFGRTPMCAALAAIRKRFEQELQDCPSETLKTLFLLSDGVPTDGSPTHAVQAIRGLGTSIVSCFVTDRDVADPRTLYGQPLEKWPDGARQMFDVASELPDDSELSSFLLRKGWTIEPKARLFVQLNHTDVLNEFVDVLLLPAQCQELEWQLPPGESTINP